MYVESLDSRTSENFQSSYLKQETTNSYSKVR